MGEKEYEHGVEESENLISFTIPENEFITLWDVFETINDHFGLLIDEFESEIIPAEMIHDVITLVSKEKYPVFYDALITAQKYDTYLAFDF